MRAQTEMANGRSGTRSGGWSDEQLTGRANKSSELKLTTADSKEQVEKVEINEKPPWEAPWSVKGMVKIK